jgi:plasmid stability protein
MATQTLTVRLPDRIYSRLEKRASESHRTIEAELIEVLATAIPTEVVMPPELANELALLDKLDDSSLWKLAQDTLSPQTSARLEQLHLDERAEGLTEPERCELANLVQQYERTTLVRARAAMLLNHRGHDVSKLVAAK